MYYNYPAIIISKVTGSRIFFIAIATLLLLVLTYKYTTTSDDSLLMHLSWRSQKQQNGNDAIGVKSGFNALKELQSQVGTRYVVKDPLQSAVRTTLSSSKLSSAKYIVPDPCETALTRSSLVKHVLKSGRHALALDTEDEKEEEKHDTSGSNSMGSDEAAFTFSPQRDVTKRNSIIGFVVRPHLLGLLSPLRSPEDFFGEAILPLADPVRHGIILDVGANIGQFAVQIVAAGLNGISFEPAPDTCVTLRKNIKAVQSKERPRGAPQYGKVEVYCAAVAADAGTGLLNVRKSNASQSRSKQTSAHARLIVSNDDGGAQGEKKDIGNNNNNNNNNKSRDSGVAKNTAEIKVVTLDAVVQAHARVLLLKIDTQGYELSVIEGARRLLLSRRISLLLIECSPYLLASTASGDGNPTYEAKVKATLQLLRKISSYGYACTHLAVFYPIDAKTGKYYMDKDGVRRARTERKFQSNLRPFVPPLNEQCPATVAGTLSFEQLAQMLSRFSPTKRSGWTDLMCWPV